MTAGPRLRDQARDDAADAAHRAGVVVRAVTEVDDLDLLRTVVHAVWPGAAAPRNLLRGLALGGAGLLVAESVADGAPVGAAIGWLGWADGVHFHAHQVGVVDEHRRTGVGTALQLTQRAQCLGHGVSEMRWTIDPTSLVAARFSAVRLGAEPVAVWPPRDAPRGVADVLVLAPVSATAEGTAPGEPEADHLELSWRLDRPVGGSLAVPGPGDDVVLTAAHPSDPTTDPRRDPVVRRRHVASVLRTALDEGRPIGVGEDGWVVAGGAA